MSQRYVAVPLWLCLPAVRAFGSVGKRKLVPGLMVREVVVNESSCAFIGYQVRIELVVICNLSY